LQKPIKFLFKNKIGVNTFKKIKALKIKNLKNGAYIMKCCLKINNLYLKDFEININNATENYIQGLTLEKNNYYIFESIDQAKFVRFLFNKELNIKEENIEIKIIKDGVKNVRKCLF